MMKQNHVDLGHTQQRILRDTNRLRHENNENENLYFLDILQGQMIGKMCGRNSLPLIFSRGNLFSFNIFRILENIEAVLQLKQIIKSRIRKLSPQLEFSEKKSLFYFCCLENKIMKHK